jgi:hypothetical protein
VGSDLPPCGKRIYETGAGGTVQAATGRRTATARIARWICMTGRDIARGALQNRFDIAGRAYKVIPQIGDKDRATVDHPTP